MNPKGWSDEDWDDYEEYLQNLSAKEIEIELKLLHSLGKAKKEGKNIVPNETFYKMWGEYVTTMGRNTNI